MDLVPCCVEGFGGFLPGKLARPMRQEVHVDLGRRMLAQTPRNLFDHDPALPAIHPPHEIDEEDEKAPDSYELKVSRLMGLIVSGGGTVAAGACRAGSLTRPDRNQDALTVAGETGQPVDETGKVMALVENTGKQHGSES